MKRWEPDEELPEEPLINLTPLIDVVFVVLIAFMLIAPVLDIDKVDLAISSGEKKKEAPSPEQSPLTIVVRADNSLWMQGRKVSFDEVERILVNQKRLYPDKTPQVIHDKNASFGTYQTVKNTLERCGFEEMDILLKPN